MELSDDMGAKGDCKKCCGTGRIRVNVSARVAGFGIYPCPHCQPFPEIMTTTNSGGMGD
jgi:hypothetical protein